MPGEQKESQEPNCEGLCGGYLKKFRETYGNSGAPTHEELKRVGDTLAGSYPTRDYPEGGSLHANMRAAMEIRVRTEFPRLRNPLTQGMVWSAWSYFHDTTLAKMEWLYGKVRAGADWDYKFQLGCPELESVGNFNYGLMASILGLSREEILDFAGAAQMVTGTWRREFSLPGKTFPRGDDFKDAVEVEAGIHFFELRRHEIEIELKQMRAREMRVRVGDQP